jgi:nucleotide-binding universal stress UspA family protein
MYDKILVPLDGSKIAERVLPYARFLATGLHLPVELMHVKDPETALRVHGADYLRKVAASFMNQVNTRCHVEEGAAAAVIVDKASIDSGTVIAMATHGQSGGQRWLLGRVAQKVLQASVNPLLVIRPNETNLSIDEVKLATIIVPLDGSQLAEKIFPHVVYLASGLKLAVVLARTYTLPTASYFMAAAVSPSDVKDIGERIKEEATSYLRAKVKELEAHGLEKVSFVLTEGRGPEEIIALAQKSSDNLVAMSSHGRSGMGRWVLGSVTDRVVSYCGDPVLVIRSTVSEL